MSGAPSLRESTVHRLADVLRDLNVQLKAADDGHRSLESRVGILEDDLREVICALLGAVNPVILEEGRKDGASPKTPPQEGEDHGQG